LHVRNYLNSSKLLIGWTDLNGEYFYTAVR
jgi:hypothetical protein